MCRPGVDHITNAGHRERGLGNVGGQHNPTAGVRLEHPMLFSRRQPGIQRQNLGQRPILLAQCISNIVDLTLTAEEHQDVAGAFLGQFIDRVADGRDLIAIVVGLNPTGRYLVSTGIATPVVDDRPR